MNCITAAAPAGLLGLGFSILKLGFLSLLLAEFFSRIGTRFIGWLSFDFNDPLRKFGFGYLAGLALIAPILLGLALTGIFYPITIAAACAAAVAAASLPGGSAWRGLVVIGLLRGIHRFGWFGIAVTGAILAPLAYYLLTPSSHIDVYIYHLATPWHHLMNHRSILTQIPLTSHLPLPIDTVFALPLILGDDRLALWLNLLAFLAAGSLFLDRCLKHDRPATALLGLLLALATGYTLMVLRYPKNDVAASSMFIAAAMAYRVSARCVGISFLGMCVAAKPAYAPLALIWVFFHPPNFRKLPLSALIAGIWIVPWLFKEYLITGNPIYPFASSLLPSLDWNETNGLLSRRLSAAFLHQDTYDAATLLPAWLKYSAREYLPILLCAPGLLLFGRRRGAVAACLVGQIGILGLAHHTRYLLPAGWLLSLMIAEEIYRLRGMRRTLPWILLAGFSIFSIVTVKSHLSFSWRDAFLSHREMQSERLTTYLETVQVLRDLEPARVLSIGERRSYLFPGRVIYGGTRGETPLIWKLVRESDGLTRLRIRFRQLGATYMAYNYVSAEWLAQLYSPFRWDLRMLRIYAEYCKRHFIPLTHNATCDFRNGGFYIYEISKYPLLPAPDTAWFMPGTEGLFGDCIKLENQGKRAELLEASLAILGMIGDIGHAWNQAGHAFSLLNDSQNAFNHLRPFYLQGMMDQLNIPEYGAIAVRVGRLEEADKVLQESKWRYPDQIDTIHVNEALLHGRQAYSALRARDLKAAASHLDTAHGLLELVPKQTQKPMLDGARLATQGALTALSADLLLAQGRFREAGLLFKKAAQAAPGNPGAGRWRRLSAKLAPPRIGLDTAERTDPDKHPFGERK